jgi:carboxylate-amine ligase
MKEYPLFSAFGVELEYMIVKNDNLSVAPISDKLIYQVSGGYKNEVEFDKIAWSNELVLHVIELKTNGPSCELEPLASYFQAEVQKINQLLTHHDARLLPTGAHPWMNPYQETALWPHGSNEIYAAYNRIFNCEGHGFANLQVTHLNLPFANDEQFAKLHAAIRLLLPIIPAIAASTPIIDSQITGFIDTRLDFYRQNQKKIPSITGEVIPETILSQKEYQEKILNPMYQEISVYDSEKILQEEWLNSRGAIARFDRNTIEIRIIDVQECPIVEMAILGLIVAVLKMLIFSEKWLAYAEQITYSQSKLVTLFLDCVKTGLDTPILEKDYLQIFGLSTEKITVRDLWKHIVEEVSHQNVLDKQQEIIIKTILERGNLAERILQAAGKNPSREQLQTIYDKLASCLNEGEMYLPS